MNSNATFQAESMNSRHNRRVDSSSLRLWSLNLQRSEGSTIAPKGNELVIIRQRDFISQQGFEVKDRVTFRKVQHPVGNRTSGWRR